MLGRMRAARPLLCSAAVLSLFMACGGPPEGMVDDCASQLALPPSVSTDILFVIDNSGSMENQQAKVVAELERFVQTLADTPVKNDFQVGVITTGVSLHGVGTCSADAEPLLIEFPEESGRLQLGKDERGQVRPESTRRILSFDDPDLVEQFGMLVRQGIHGSGQEMGLEAIRLALSEPLISQDGDADPPGNAGFLRPGSRLLVVIVSDEDDCSEPEKTRLVLRPICGDACVTDADCGGPGHYCVPDDDTGALRCEENVCETPEGRAQLEPVETYVEFLQSLDDGTGTGRQREVSLAVIGSVDEAGNPERCVTETEHAYGTAVRYARAVELMEERGFIDSICRESFAETLERIAELVNAPQVIELPGSVLDGNLLRVTIRRPEQDPIQCTNDDGFTYEPAVGDAPPRIVMDGRCRLRNRDALDVDFVCAS